MNKRVVKCPSCDNPGKGIAKLEGMEVHPLGCHPIRVRLQLYWCQCGVAFIDDNNGSFKLLKQEIPSDWWMLAWADTLPIATTE